MHIKILKIIGGGGGMTPPFSYTSYALRFTTTKTITKKTIIMQLIIHFLEMIQTQNFQSYYMVFGW